MGRNFIPMTKTQTRTNLSSLPWARSAKILCLFRHSKLKTRAIWTRFLLVLSTINKNWGNWNSQNRSMGCNNKFLNTLSRWEGLQSSSWEPKSSKSSSKASTYSGKSRRWLSIRVIWPWLGSLSRKSSNGLILMMIIRLFRMGLNTIKILFVKKLNP